VALGAACLPRVQQPTADDTGDVARGRELIREYGCAACHAVPGVPVAHGSVGPPLANYGERQTVAGRLPNTPENLLAWIRSPQTIDPGNVMPNLGVTALDAADIGAYLFSLE